MGAHVTKAERQAYVKTFRNSGLTQTAFCKHININSRTFGHWVRTSLENKTVSASQSPIYEEDISVEEESGRIASLTVASQPSFIPVKVMDTADCKQTDKGDSSPTSAIPAPCELAP